MLDRRHRPALVVAFVSGQRINLADLHERAAPGFFPHRVTLRADVLLAFVEAVEAAEHHAQVCSGETEGALETHGVLCDALARFEFAGDA